MNLERVNSAFLENFSSRGELGASVSVWRRGHEVLSLGAGFCDREKARPWTASTLVLFWSATKGPSAACVLHSLQQHKLTLETRVAEIWPEFAQNGKGAITMGEILSHRAGLAALDETVPVTDYAAVIDALARQAPLWPLREGHGYHARTIGFLMDEIVRRLNEGITLGDYWRMEFAGPLDLEIWIGLPAEKLDRVAPVYAMSSGEMATESVFYNVFKDVKSLTHRAFTSPAGLNGASIMNTREARMGSYPAFGGIGSATAMAKFYSMLANGGEMEGRRFFLPATIDWMKTTLTSGFDRVSQLETAYSAGFMKDPLDATGKKLRSTLGPSTMAFGHPGAGGSLAFADQENEISFAYVMNRMGAGVMPNERARALVAALYD